MDCHVAIRVRAIQSYLLQNAGFRRPPVVELEQPLRRGSFDVMAGLAVNRFIADPAQIEAHGGGVPAPSFSRGQRGRWKWHDFMQSVDDVTVVGFSRNFPWVARLSGWRDFSGFGKVLGTRTHALLKIGLLLGKPVF